MTRDYQPPPRWNPDGVRRIQPCPFCGQKDQAHLRVDQQNGRAWVQCVSCGARGPTAASPDQAEQRWSDRPVRLV